MNSPTSLSQAQGTLLLVEAARAILREQPLKKRNYDLNLDKSYLAGINSVLTIISGAFLISFYFYALKRDTSHPYQYRATGVLFEGLLLLLALAWNYWLDLREKRLTDNEMSTRIASVLDQISKFGISDKQDIRFPTNIPTICLTRLVRDSQVILYPWNLCVEGDLLLLAFGDKAPAKVQYVYSINKENCLVKDQIFKPSLFAAMDPKKVHSYTESGTNHGLYYFRVLETPLREILLSSINYSRPQTAVSHQLEMMEDFLARKFLPLYLSLCLLINILRYVLPAGLPDRIEDGYEILVNLQLYALFPLLSLFFPAMSLIARSYGNAQILSLFEALQSSETAFEDNPDVDEFDAVSIVTYHRYLHQRRIYISNFR